MQPIKFIIIFLFLFFINNTINAYEIIIKGNEKLSTDDLQSLTNIDLKKQNFDKLEIDKLLKDFYKSDLIFDYSLKFQDEKALILLKESMIIENIYINNNLFIEDDLINKQLSSKVGHY